ncbi:MAG: alpha-glucosidase C-terminal domain-containing protein [Intestinimonas sp.]
MPSRGAPPPTTGTRRVWRDLKTPSTAAPTPGEEDAELIAWYRALGKARRELAPLRRGALCYTAAEGDVLAFTRTWEEDTVLCACNAGRECARVTLPWSAAEIGGLLCFPTDPDTGEAVVELPPLTGYLLRKSPGRE